MPNIDLSSANLGRVAGQIVDRLIIANQLIWSAVTADGPYYVNDVSSISPPPNAFSDGTPNIVVGHLVLFHNEGFATGVRWHDLDGGAGNWVFGLREVTTSDGTTPDTGALKLTGSNITVASSGVGLRDSSFSSPVPVEYGKFYLVTRYSSTGHYVHASAFAGEHGTFTNADPVYIPGYGEDDSSVVPGWTFVHRSLFAQGSGDVVPTGSTGAGPYYGVSPVFYKSL